MAAQIQAKPAPMPTFAPTHTSLLQRKCACGGTSGPDGECAECREKRLQRRSTGQAEPSTVPPVVHDVLRSPGQPLDANVRAFMEPRFGHDFGRVRVYTDAKAAESAQAVSASAYAVGSSIVFGAGRLAPETLPGKRLLAHELTHVVQQGGGIRQSAYKVAPDDAPSEREAEQTAEAISRGDHPAPVTQGQVPTQVARQGTGALGAPCPSCHSLADQVAADPQLDILAEIPVIFVIEPIDLPLGTAPTLPTQGAQPGAPSGGMPSSSVAEPAQTWDLPGHPLTSTGLSMHVLASGDLGWLSSGDAARRVLSSQYWSPLVPSRGTVTLDRLLNDLPRDLAPRIEGELAANRPLSWIQRGFSQTELESIPQLVRRLNTQGMASLTAQELDVLARAAAIHGGVSGGASPGSPWASYTRPGTDPGGAWSGSRYRVRVEIPRANVLDISAPNELTQRFPQLLNQAEAELMATADHRGRIVSVQRMSGSAKPSFAMRYSGAIRLGGRAFVLVGIATSGYRIANAPPEERPTVIAEEGGGMVGGALGTAAAVAGCVALGIATGGVGLVVCGLVGGIVGGVAGSSVAGEGMRLLQAGGTRCPSCHAQQREWEANRSLRDLTPTINVGGSVNASTLTQEEIQRIRRWIEDTTRDPARSTNP